MAWLLEAHLLERVTKQEWRWISSEQGDQRLLLMHREAAFALAWVLGIAMDLDPARPAAHGLLSRLPDLSGGEAYQRWRARTLIAPREPADVAAQVDLYTCLERVVGVATEWRVPLPASLTPETVGQRRIGSGMVRQSPIDVPARLTFGWPSGGRQRAARQRGVTGGLPFGNGDGRPERCSDRPSCNGDGGLGLDGTFHDAADDLAAEHDEDQQQRHRAERRTREDHCVVLV